MRMGIAIGIDIGGTFTKLVAVTTSGEIVARTRAETREATPADLVSAIDAEVRRLEEQVGAAAIGVACPGLVRRDGEAIHWMKGRLEALEHLNWSAALRRGAPVPVINDAHAALAAETWLGAARGCRDVVLLTLGTGVGGAILADGRLLTGSTGRAGHLGHISLDPAGPRDIVHTPGSLEEAIGNCTVGRRSGGRFASTEALVRAHLQGDTAATAVWHASVRALAAALASIINALDPSRIILGGGITARAGDALFTPLRRFMDDYEWRPDDTSVAIVPAALGDEAGAIGAAKQALERSA